MGYMVIADKLDMGELGDWEYGFAPKHPVLNERGTEIIRHDPGKFYAGETFSHCGVDAANLLAGPEGWRIVALSWTRLQPPACDLHPDGPPAGE